MGQHGKSNEGNESHGCHESHEGHEEEGREQDRQGQTCKVGGFPWIQGKDRWWLDCRSPEGKEGTQREGLRRCQERYSSLQEGKGVLQLSVSGWLQLRPWGYLQPWSAAASDCISIVELFR